MTRTETLTQTLVSFDNFTRLMDRENFKLMKVFERALHKQISHTML